MADPGVDIGRQDVEVVKVTQVFCGIKIGQLDGILARFVGPADDLVIDVSEVGGIEYFITAEDEIAAYHVEDHGRHGMANMGVGINRRTADVHAHLARFHRHECFFLTG